MDFVLFCFVILISSFEKIVDGDLKVTVTRQNRDVSISKYRLTTGQRSFVFRGAIINLEPTP